MHNIFSLYVFFFFSEIFSDGEVDSVACFKVTMIESGAGENATGNYVIDPTITKIVQESSVFSVLPPAKVLHYYMSNHSHSSSGNDRIQCPAMKEIRKTMQSALHPLAKTIKKSISIILYGPPGAGKRHLVRSIANDMGIKYLEVNAFDLLVDKKEKFREKLNRQFSQACELAPCILLINKFDMIRKTLQNSASTEDENMASILNGIFSDLNNLEYPVITIATTINIEAIPPAFRNCFSTEILLEAPSENKRYRILRELAQDKYLAPDVNLKHLAAQTASLSPRDLIALISQAEMFALTRLKDEWSSKWNENLNRLIDIGIPITLEDLDKSSDLLRQNHSESIGAPKIPSVSWDDVGGLISVKRDILDTIQLPLQNPEMFASGVKKRSGVLLYGPPGTGKTLLAKAVATTCSLNFLSVKGPELLNMYIGESEANVRRIFQKARDARPCVIFFDELDSIAPKRGEKGDSGGVMDRIVSQLLSELDDMAGSDGGNVFVIGATNRPDLLDQALLRPGRFDKLIYLGVSETHEAQYNILQALTRKFRLAPDLNLKDIAIQCPFTYTGADFYALCSGAMLKAMVRTIKTLEYQINEKNKSRSGKDVITTDYHLSHMVDPSDIEVVVKKEDFELALDELVQSVSATEMAHYKWVQESFSVPTQNENSSIENEKEQTQKSRSRKKGKGKAS